MSLTFHPGPLSVPHQWGGATHFLEIYWDISRGGIQNILDKGC